jgi:predicted outer membrane lipoprotein
MDNTEKQTSTDKPEIEAFKLEVSAPHILTCIWYEHRDSIERKMLECIVRNYKPEVSS